MICVMDEAFMGAKHGINGRWSLSRFRYQPVLAVLLLPSLLLIGIFSYYPAVRSLIGGFYQWNGFSAPVYAGISQFKQYLQSPDFSTEVKNIAVLTGGAILISIVSQFTAAEIVTRMPPAAGRHREVRPRPADRAAATGADRGVGVSAAARVRPD